MIMLIAAAALLSMPKDDLALTAYLKVANDTAIETSKTALERSRSEAVRDFARRLIKEASQANEELTAAARTQGFTPQEPRPSSREEQDRPRSGLSKETGPDFDEAYLTQQARAHHAVLAVLDRALAEANGRTESFASVLQKTRDLVAKHLEEAQSLQKHPGS